MITKRLGVRHAVSSVIVLAGLAVAVRHGAADAPAGQYTISSGTVTDNKTGLVWQQAVPASKYNWAGATAYCTNNTAGLPGTGWRLPSLTELQSIVDDSRQSPAIDPTAFPSTPVDNFWTSSPYVPTASYVWYVFFADGRTYNTTTVAAQTSSVRCVR